MSTASRLVQVACVLCLLSVVAFAWGARQARAFGERLLFPVGEHAMRLVSAENQSEPISLQLNGAQLYLSHGASDESMGEVLDRFAAECRARDGGFAELLGRAKLRAKADLRARLEGADDGVLRLQSDERGVVACLATGSQPLSLGDFATRAQRFLDSGDLSALGDLRYAMVTPGEDRTTFVTIWSEGPVDVRAMFPEHGDAPGVDLPKLQRISDSRRVLSALGDGSGSLLNVLELPLSVEAARAHYLAELPRAGYRILSRSDTSLTATDDASLLVLGFSPQGAARSDEKSVVTLVTHSN